MQPLAVRAQQPGVDANAIAETYLSLVDRMGFRREAGIARPFPVIVADPKMGVKLISREIEDHDVKSQIQMAVGVDPLGTDDIFVFEDIAAHGAAHLVAAHASGQVPAV